MMYVDPKLYVRGDAGGILSNILASEWLFRLGFVSSLISLICFLFLANVLYTLLKSVDKDQARLMVVLVAAGGVGAGGTVRRVIADGGQTVEAGGYCQ